eukprot:CAMPEP_0172182952 /NCGR_PEP_ID=MMETSP1050-20130122/18699_1 /TAXON_ID=233186 /ORGANISM="Cryptomonas curvata, Strain CCAP979/52" /LENGTH=91 /DNA_ID=CAMNT_0012856483 /DNA_START=245 /DNA_END=520 /DNA_ORIENTATION=-
MGSIGGWAARLQGMGGTAATAGVRRHGCKRWAAVQRHRLREICGVDAGNGLHGCLGMGCTAAGDRRHGYRGWTAGLRGITAYLLGMGKAAA